MAVVWLRLLVLESAWRRRSAGPRVFSCSLSPLCFMGLAYPRRSMGVASALTAAACERGSCVHALIRIERVASMVVSVVSTAAGAGHRPLRSSHV